MLIPSCCAPGLPSFEEGTVATTIISYEEQIRGWMAFMAKKRKIEFQVEAYYRLKRQLGNYGDVIVLDFDLMAATMFEQLRQSRIRIGTQDLKIAAITLVTDGLLLSRNLRDFRQIFGLQVEDRTV